MKQELINKDGRKYTISEFFKEYTDGIYSLYSIKGGHIGIGTADQFLSDLNKKTFGACVQYIETSEDIIKVYIR